MTELKRTQDRKTANFATPNGKASKIANAFSLPAGRAYSCPDATEYCESICYAGKLERIYKGFRNVVLSNWELLKDATLAEMEKLLDAMISNFEAECDKHNAPKLFRIHADGDFFSLAYISAWEHICATHKETHFWFYTRSRKAAEWFHELKLGNVSFYFSGDHCNIKDAMELSDKGILIAYVDDTFEMARHAFKGAKCPEQTKAIPLISKNGGACITCGLCINGRRNVLFSKTKR